MSKIDNAAEIVEFWAIQDKERPGEGGFLLVRDDKPWMLVECKLSSPGSLDVLRRFGEAVGVKDRYVVTLTGDRDFLDRETGVRVIPAARFLPGMGV